MNSEFSKGICIVFNQQLVRSCVIPLCFGNGTSDSQQHFCRIYENESEKVADGEQIGCVRARRTREFDGQFAEITWQKSNKGKKKTNNQNKQMFASWLWLARFSHFYHSNRIRTSYGTIYIYIFFYAYLLIGTFCFLFFVLPKEFVVYCNENYDGFVDNEWNTLGILERAHWYELH